MDTGKVLSCLGSTVGFGDTSLAPDLTTSDSGLYFDRNGHSLVTIPNLRATAPEHTIGNESAFWLFLKDAKEAAALAVAGGVAVGDGRTVMAAKLFDDVGNINDKIIPQGRFRALEIRKKPNSRISDILPLVNAVYLQLSGPAQDIPVYIYHPEQDSPLKVVLHDRIDSKNFVRTPVSILKELQALEATGITTERLYIGYYESDLTEAGIQAIERKKDLFKGPCNSCGSSYHNQKLYEAYSPYFEVRALTIEAANLDGVNLPDLNSITYNRDTNHGINLEVAAICDLSTYLCQRANSLAPLINQQFTVSALEAMAYSTRANAIEEQVQQMALHALAGNDGKGGERAKLAEMMAEYTKRLSPTPCLPCDNKGVTTKSVFG
jgi:hypothetical protein